METETVKTVKHTPLPWRIVHEPKGWGKRTVMFGGSESEEVDNHIMDDLYPTDQTLTDWKLIVRACNSHYELLEALNNIMTICYKVDSGEIHRTDEISSLIGSEINNALSKSNLLTK